MKKIALITILILLITLALVIVINLYPKEINLNAQGVKYRLGIEHKKTEKLVNVNIEGKLYKSISGKRRFTGTIDIEGEEIPVPVDQRKLNIIFTNDGWGVMSYHIFEFKENGGVAGTDIYQYGSIFINNDFNKVSILVSDQNQLNGNGGTAWGQKMVK
ncbi:hypothetical protein [Paenibacillus crassostreae]|uniref:hypothetical protein n=1 Tax=Paenibacillus crassostreae TaxID=1763538 RepID=UPI0008DBBD75|nr:hypothetical protein [Paenibacillus crassostreae]AOZ94498.1 hypothetical protein LPB68_21390 [Paenibacillus crassostreae]